MNKNIINRGVVVSIFVVLLLFMHIYPVASYGVQTDLSKIQIAIASWPPKRHPHRALLMEAYFIQDQIYETLLKKNSKGEIVSNLAKSWRYGEDLKSINVELRKKIYFSNGVELKAKHVRETIISLIKSNTIRSVNRIIGAEALRSGKTNELEGFKIIGPYTFSLMFSTRHPRALDFLCDESSAPILEQEDSDLPLGNGAYALVKWNDRDKFVKLKRNEYYHGDKAQIKEVIISTEVNNDTAITFPGVATTHQENKYVIPYFDVEVVYLGFNTSHPFLKSKDTRLALSLLLTDDIIKRGFQELKYQLGGFIPIGYAGHSNSIKTPSSDFNLKTRLKQNITISTYRKEFVKLAEYYCGNIQVSGVGCEVRFVNNEQLHKDSHGSKLQMFIARFRPESVEELLGMFSYQSNFNLFFPKERTGLSKEYDEMYDNIMSISSEQKERLVEAYKRFDEELIKQSIVKPISYGGEKQLYVKKGYLLPTINTNGPYGIKIKDITIRSL